MSSNSHSPAIKSFVFVSPSVFCSKGQNCRPQCANSDGSSVGQFTGESKTIQFRPDFSAVGLRSGVSKGELNRMTRSAPDASPCRCLPPVDFGLVALRILIDRNNDACALLTS